MKWKVGTKTNRCFVLNMEVGYIGALDFRPIQAWLWVGGSWFVRLELIYLTLRDWKWSFISDFLVGLDFGISYGTDSEFAGHKKSVLAH